MDVNGNIGMAYSVVSSTQVPSLRYTGRFSTDPLGTMTVEEQVYAPGSQSDPSFRYGDYAQMTIDPNDDKTFWAISEFFAEGTRKNQVGVFKLAPDYNLDAGPISIDEPKDGLLSDSETITITVRNFGIDTLFELPVSYQIDSGDVVTEVISDTIISSNNFQYSFTVTADLSEEGRTYQIKTWTSLEGDEDTSNDTLVGMVTHLFPNDIGVENILSPTTGFGLTESETVSLLLRNFGGAPQVDFDVTYVLNDTIIVTETVTDTLQPLSNLIFDFMETGDFLKIGDYTLSTYTSLATDTDNSNDTATSVVTHKICAPDIDCTEGDGIARLELSNIDNISGCDPNGYGDYMHLVADVEMGPLQRFDADYILWRSVCKGLD